MECVLNKGLKFAILPLRLDITQVLTDFRRHERSMVWKEFFHGKENDIPYKPPMFKQKKHNFPQKHRAPKGLYDYLAAVQSDIMDPKNRNKVTSNISNEEKEALKELIKLQRERKIVIKPCDKGAGIIILNFKEYIKACMDHLEAKTSTGENYYKEVDDNKLLEAKEKITNIVKEGFDNDILSKEEFSATLPHADEAPIAGSFYCTFKVHKEYEHGKAPPPRGIVSCSGTLTENIAIFVENHIKELGQSHEAFLEDTPHFLRHVEEINQQGPLPDNAKIVVVDVIGLYPNIPPDEGVQCVGEALRERGSSKVPSGYIQRLLQIIQDYSIFEFDQRKYQQQFGTTLGTKPAPHMPTYLCQGKLTKKSLQLQKNIWKIDRYQLSI